MKNRQDTKKKKSVLREWVDSILIAFILAMFVRVFFFEFYKIPTSSMVATLIPGDRILVGKIIYGPRIPFVGVRIPGYRKPQRGEVIVFISPPEKSKAYVKRIVGFGGEEVEISQGSIYIDGREITDPRIRKNFYYNFGKFGQEGKVTKIPDDSYFVLGDNSASSRDSRHWGFVPAKDVLGKAILIWWPPKRIRMIE
ncbi:MAG: signal peptidase I [Candidatus Omnitrophica bacterium]|nr:signal peptidase I [Candidatus Omnitrophota bacterium]